jgi:hypothetical protein
MDIPEKFPEVVRDFFADLSVAFPEYLYLWKDGYDIPQLYQYCLTVYPERFFDILYQNEEIFLPESPVNTMFLPNIEFKMLYSTEGISENTKKALWKYLQLVLITIMGNIKTSASFGDTASLFEGVEEEELQKKLAETVEGLTDFFKGMSQNATPEGMEKVFEEMFASNEQQQQQQQQEEQQQQQQQQEDGAIPNADDLHNHLKSLFDGKIGTLAKELAEEMSGDVMSMFSDGDEAKDTDDVLKKMMRNPKKIMEIVKKIGTRLDDKMKSGSISQEELMKEAGEMMSKMKGGAGGKEFQDMMKNMMKTMGGKGMFDMNKMSSMMGQSATKDRMRAKMEERKAQAQANYTLESKAPNEFVFKLPDEGVQEKSQAPVKQPEITDDWLEDIQSGVKNPSGEGGKKKKKGKSKK